VSVKPDEDGFAVVEVALVERAVRPRGVLQWGARAGESLVNREVQVSLPGFSGQGELWSASWRWWTRRPRVAMSFATPRSGSLPGVWRVTGSWEAQEYAAADGARVTETRAHAGFDLGDWLTRNLRYGAGLALDEWNGDRLTASISGTLERRFDRDRLAVAADAALYLPASEGPVFGSAGVRAQATSSAAPARWVATVTAGASAVSADAPALLWPGAGGGRVGRALLRAHPLLHDGVVDGAAFGRGLVHASGELRRWFGQRAPIEFGVAAFADAARATRGISGAAAWHLDAGGGLRVRMAGMAGALRVDVARGLRDRARAVTVVWERELER
jgi:hypothetical protein